jgi:DNA-binding MarR family transcriptional regulator
MVGNSSEINEIVDKLNQINRELEKLSLSKVDDQSSIIVPDADLLKLAKGLLYIWNSRNSFLDRSLIYDPGWMILLTLKIDELRKQKNQVTTVCMDSGAPATTALRWIKLLESRSLIVIEPDRNDGRRKYVSLTEEASSAMSSYLRNIQNYLTTVGVS